MLYPGIIEQNISSYILSIYEMKLLKSFQGFKAILFELINNLTACGIKYSLLVGKLFIVSLTSWLLMRFPLRKLWLDISLFNLPRKYPLTKFVKCQEMASHLRSAKRPTGNN